MFTVDLTQEHYGYGRCSRYDCTGVAVVAVRVVKDVEVLLCAAHGLQLIAEHLRSVPWEQLRKELDL